MVAFDAASAIAQFVSEPERTSLELPHLTTGQRKHVKALLQQYPDLRCDSYGFGADRRLHVFKKGCTPDSDLDDDTAQISSAQLPVRKTFIQFDETADERAVQSMPHGMFRQSILAESHGQTAPEPEAEPVTSPPAYEADRHAPLGIGALVVVEGLTKLPAFNGLSAVVQGWDEATGRYSIMLVSVEGGCQQAKVKQENLRLLMPCPDAA